MSDTGDTAPAQGLRTETVMIAAVCILALAAVWYLLSQRQQVLRSSPAGLDGLEVWLESEGVRAQSFFGGWPIEESTVGLLVVPVYDTALDADRRLPGTTEELLMQQDEYDLWSEPVREKASRVRTLVVLPKWRSGMRLTGLAHPVLLVERRGAEGVLRRVTGLGNARIAYARTPFTDFRYAAGDGGGLIARIYAAQGFVAPDCTPLIGEAGRMLLGECPVAGEDARVLVLADPDLLNNHGLRLGENAEIARHLLAAEAGGGRVLIDYSDASWLIEAGSGVSRERTWSDLMRFFDYPFGVMWIGAGLLMALGLWRGALRYGPIRSSVSPHGASKGQAIGAQARLLRLTDQDGTMIADYAAARIGATAAALFGPAHAWQFGSERAFVAFVRRRHADQAARLEAVLEEIRGLPPRVSAAEAIRHVDQLEDVLEKIADDT